MKKTLKNRIPKYALGDDGKFIGIKGNDALTALEGISSLTTNAIQSNKGGANLGTALSGAAGGAMTGMMIGGPMGAAIGGAAGLITGSIGNKGSVDINTGEVTDGSGILGLFGPSKDELLQKGGKIKANLVAKNNSAAIAEQYYSQHGENDYSLAANGGILPTTLAYLDDGELIRTPQGEIMEIPEEGKPEDSNLAKVPVGTQVLSDKLKVPGTNRTFAQEGKRIMKNKKYGNDKYAQTSKMLNDRNALKAYDELLQTLEDMKKKKGLKKTNKYADGTYRIRRSTETPLYDTRSLSDMISVEPLQNTVTNYNKLMTGSIPQTRLSTKTKSSNNKLKTNDIVSGLSSLTSAGSALAGALSNTREKASTSPRFGYTPKFVPTDYDINPLLEEINRTNTIGRYNQANISPNTGAGMAYGLQLAANRDRSIMQAYNQKRLYENQNAATNAGIYNDWARYDAADRMRQWDTNEANAAAARNIRRKGISQISTIIPSMIRDYRLLGRDNAMLEMMIPFLSKGMTNEQIENLLKNLI